MHTGKSALVLVLHSRESRRRPWQWQRLEQQKWFLQMWNPGAERRTTHHRGAVSVLGDGEELIGSSVVVCGQQHSVLCWVVADAPEATAAPCATLSSQAQAFRSLLHIADVVLSSSTLLCVEPYAVLLKPPLDSVPTLGPWARALHPLWMSNCHPQHADAGVSRSNLPLKPYGWWRMGIGSLLTPPVPYHALSTGS